MRNMIRSLAVVVGLVPAVAFGAITNSKHDLASGSTAAVKATAGSGSDQTCIFCHTPHKASVTGLLWNRADGTGTGWAASSKTLAGTPLPIASGIGAPSKRCLSCHDGTIALGDVMSRAVDFTMAGGTGVGTAFMTVTGAVGGAAAGSLAGNHPISVPYPIGVSTVYNGVTSLATASGNFQPLNSSTCTSATGLCTTATTVGDPNGSLKINLYGTAAQPGVECGTCHEVHNKYSTNNSFLRVSTAQSAICVSCHTK